jgi:hypothetical protein
MSAEFKDWDLIAPENRSEKSKIGVADLNLEFFMMEGFGYLR